MRWIKLTCIFFLAMNLGCKKEDADLMLFNGKIYTVNKVGEVVTAMVIRGDRIVALGSEADLKNRYRAKGEKDLGGKSVYPGFIDPHCHFYEYGLVLRQADLVGTRSADEIYERLAAHFNKMPVSWILGRGWDQNDWKDKNYPRKEILDKLFPNVPVYLTRIDGHAAWVNTKALEMAGIQAGIKVKGGEVLSDKNGTTGILIDNAMSLVEKLIPPPDRGDQVHALLKAQANCFEVGLTSVGDAGLDKNIVLLMDSLQQQGLLSMRINAMLKPSTQNIDYFINKGIYSTDRLTVRSIKLFADGALGSRGALLKKPYSDDPSTHGIQVTTTKFLTDICNLAYRQGFQVNTHCIGDSAVSLILHIYAGIIPRRNDLRWRLEHAQVVDPADMDMIRQYSVIPSVQTTHATSDMYWAEERLGPVRILSAYSYRTLLAQNGWLANGSDFPVESINPLYGFYAAISRKDLNGFPPGGFMMQESLDRSQALQAMTIWAAKACFEEKEKGSLEEGKFADFVILDKDIMKAEEADIPGIKVLETFVGGKRMENK